MTSDLSFHPPAFRAPLRVLALAVAVLSVGCGPYVRDTLREVRGYTSPTPCGQGPYVIELEGAGERWGESVQFAAYGPARINMRYEVVVGGEVEAEGNLNDFRVQRPVRGRDGNTSLTLQASEDAFDNSACSLSHVEAALDAGASPSGGELNVQTRVVVSESGSATTAAIDGDGNASLRAQDPALELVPWPENIRPQDMLRRRLGVTRWVTQTWTNSNPDGPAPLPAGTPITIRLWGDVPNPLEGVTFVVQHRVRRPSVSDTEYEAHLREEDAEEERERAEDEQERIANAARPPSRRERHRAAQNRRRAEQARERREFCDSHHFNTDCWGEGGHAGHLRREEGRRLERERAAAATIPRPEGPPPPPRAEAPPPKASTNANWVAGYWHWVGEWVWIAGRWDVPEADLLAQATVHAPMAPPPPRAEPVPPQPAAVVVWIAGYWQWNGARFVWVGGHWDVAPPGAQWQAPRWRVEGRGAIFVPGSWRIQIR